MPEIVFEMPWIIVYTVAYLIFIFIERWEELKSKTDNAVSSLLIDISIIFPCFMYIFKINSDYFISMGLVLHVVGLFSLVKYVGAKFKDDLAKNKSISASVFGVLGVCVIVLFLTPIFIVDWLLFQKMKNIFF